MSNVVVTPCEAPDIAEMFEPRYLDQPRYVCYGHVTRDARGHETGELRWEKHEVVLPVL